MLSFRAGLRGSYFALITLAFAEVFRILANSVPFTRGGLGMLIKADPRPINFQFSDPIWLYYLALLLCVVSLLIAWQLTRSRFGARLVAIRENEDAARALGIDVFAEKVKVLTLSGAMCAAGGTFYAQKYLYIDPNIAFGIDKSVEMLLVTMVGGAGTIFGPLIGSVALTGINELTRWLAGVVPALKNVQPLSLVVYGAMLILIVARLPDGLREPVRRQAAAMLEVRDLSKSFGGLKAVDEASLDVRAGEIVGLIGPNGAGKTTLFAAIAGFHKPDAGRITFEGHDITGLAPHRICAAGMVRTFQITQPFARISVRENIMVGAYFRTADRAHGRARGRGGRGHRSAWRTSSTSRAPISPSPAASGWSLPARSPPARACCCSTR